MKRAFAALGALGAGATTFSDVLFAQWWFPPAPTPVSTPEIDGTAGIAAMALLAGVVAILYRKARK